MMTKTKTMFLMLIAVAGCKAKVTSGGGGDSAPLPDEMAAFMPKDASAAWQGAWASRMTLKTSGTISMAGDPAAIEVKGDDATAYDGKTEHKLNLVIAAPCLAQFGEKSDGPMGSTMTTKHDKQFLIVNGQLQAGEGAAGYRKGKAAVVCTVGMSGVVTLDDKGACKEWSNFMGKWDGKPTTCTWSQADGKDVLTIGTGDWATKVQADGDTLTNEQFRDEVKQGLHAKAADYAAAKAKVDELLKAKG